MGNGITTDIPGESWTETNSMNLKHDSIASRAGMLAQDIPNEARWNPSSYVMWLMNSKETENLGKNNFLYSYKHNFTQNIASSIAIVGF